MCLYYQLGFDSGQVDDLTHPLPNVPFSGEIFPEVNQTQQTASFPCPTCGENSFTCSCYGQEDNDE